MSEANMDIEGLDSILNGTSEAPEAAPAATPAPAEAAPAEASPERPRDPATGQFLPKGENEPEPQAAAPAPESAPPAPSDDDSSPTVPRKALIDERSKRQSLESQLEEMRQRLAQVPAPQPPQPQAPPDPWDDPEGHSRFLLEQAGQVAGQQAVQAVQRHLVMVSAEAAKVKHPDYMEKVPVFEQLAQANPGLWDQMFQHPNPAEFAYGVAKQHQEVSQYGSIDEMLAAKKAEWEAEALERLKGSLPASPAPPTLSTERNVGQRSGPAWSGPVPLGDLLQ